MVKQKQRHSKEYVSYKKQEYLRNIALTNRFLDEEVITEQIYQIISIKVAEFVQSLDDIEVLQLPLIPQSVLLEKLDKVTADIRVIVANRFKRALTELWEKTFKLGIRHQIMDLMYDSGLFDKEFKKITKKQAKYSSLLGNTTFSGHVLSRDDVAEFKENNPPDTRAKTIIQAKRRNTVLKNNLDKLKRQGLYDEKLVGTENFIAGRLNIEERLTFFDMTQEISDFSKRAEVAERDFIGNKYMDNRIRVLTTDYAQKYDKRVKEQVSGFLTTNVEGTKQIKDSFSNGDLTVSRIKQILMTGTKRKDIKEQASNRSKTILRTELNLAYNFGKLSGFTSPEDRNRRVRINADWELEGQLPGYEVCDFCAAVDGTVVSIRETLFMGTQADRGILTFLGTNQTTTSFKNPNMLVLPLHPNCLVATTKVSMYSLTSKLQYIKEIKDIQEGEYVVTPNGYQKVTKTHKNWHGEQVFKIRTETGQELIATGNHPIWTRVGWKDAENVCVGETIYLQNLPSSQTHANNSERVLRGFTKSDCNIRPVENIKQNRVRTAEVFRDTSEQGRKQYSFCEHTRKKSQIFSKNEREQSYLYPRGKGKNSTDQNENTLSQPLPAIKRQGEVQSVLPGRFRSVLQECMGGQHSPYSKFTWDEMGIRECDRTRRRVSVFPRFLSTGLEHIHRSKRFVDRRWVEKASRYLTAETDSGSGNRQQEVSSLDKGVQGLNSVRVVSVESYLEPQFVYNLTVENEEVYFAGGILVHNCNCFYTLEPRTREEIELAREIPTPVVVQQQIPESEQELNDLFNELAQEGASSNITEAVLATAGAGLVIGGAFLLARSNVFKSFLQSTKTTTTLADDLAGRLDALRPDIPKPPTTPVREPITRLVDDIKVTGQYVKDELPPEVGERFSEVLTDVVVGAGKS